MSDDIRALLAQEPRLTGDLPDAIAEGAVLPETYCVRRGDDRTKVIARMQAQMQAALDKAWQARNPDVPLRTPQEALILASIVEKETGLPQERGRVAAVFLNRLRRGMKLQADPTTVYGIFRASGEKTLNRIVTEARANHSEFDIVTISEVDALIDAKLLAPYRSPEAKSFIPEFKDPNGYWTAIYINYTTIGYNPTLVSEKEAPKQWEDLLDPKWKGRFAIDQEQYPWYGTLHKAWGRERAQKYMRALAKQNIQWRKGHTLIAQLMAAGEFPLGVVYAHRVEEMKQRGAPIEWVNTANPIVVTVNAAGLSTKPQHPTTAKLFYDFLFVCLG